MMVVLTITENKVYGVQLKVKKQTSGNTKNESIFIT
jgi:hypothetical protein